MPKFWIFILLLCLVDIGYTDTLQKNEKVFKQGFYLNAFPDITLADLDVALRFWTEEISKQVGISSSMTLYESIDQMKTDFDQGKINFIVASPLAILNKFDINQLSDGYKITFPDLKVDKLLVVTHIDSGFDDFNKLKNKRLSLLENEPVSTMYANLLALQNFGRKARQVFNNVNHFHKSNQLILKLFFKNTDVIFVYKDSYDLAIELNPQIRLKTQVISALSNVPRALGFFHRNVDSEFRETVLNVLLNLHEHPRGQQILNIFFAEKLIRSKIGDLSSVQKMQKTYLQLINQQRALE